MVTSFSRIRHDIESDIIFEMNINRTNLGDCRFHSSCSCSSSGSFFFFFSFYVYRCKQTNAIRETKRVEFYPSKVEKIIARVVCYFWMPKENIPPFPSHHTIKLRRLCRMYAPAASSQQSATKMVNGNSF